MKWSTSIFICLFTSADACTERNKSKINIQLKIRHLFESIGGDKITCSCNSHQSFFVVNFDCGARFNRTSTTKFGVFRTWCLIRRLQNRLNKALFNVFILHNNAHQSNPSSTTHDYTVQCAQTMNLFKALNDDLKRHPQIECVAVIFMLLINLTQYYQLNCFNVDKQSDNNVKISDYYVQGNGFVLSSGYILNGGNCIAMNVHTANEHFQHSTS